MTTFKEKLDSGYYSGTDLEYPNQKDFDDFQQYLDKAKAVRGIESQRHDEFKPDVLKAVKLENHPKKEKAWAVAWEFGEAASCHDIYYNLKKLAYLLLED